MAVIYLRLTEEEKKRIERAARKARRSVANYVLTAVMKQVEADKE